MSEIRWKCEVCGSYKHDKDVHEDEDTGRLYWIYNCRECFESERIRMTDEEEDDYYRQDEGRDHADGCKPTPRPTGHV